tara:strand:- start:257 stop:832 length:576 start_codon:yes stop_codon:yes gene_type:complete
MALSTISSNAITDGTIATADIANSAVTAAKASGLGISEADQYRITSGFTQGGSQSIISSNWERADTDGFGKLGTGVSQSSGIFSFASTGVYYITAGAYHSRNNAAALNAGHSIFTTTDNSSYNSATTAYTCFENTDGKTAGTFSAFIFDVTNTTTHKAALYQMCQPDNCSNMGADSTGNYTYITFIRLGDT